ncbi:YnfA family protein [Escherichia coli]|uniref:YnfA family protein n=2 Tax=Escherichia coli TaxID=562 RepID=UPI00203F67F6|nr:hypothetical protein [Escherichia coli]ULJ37265.1 hypothetical protein HUZ78_02890 [Shigella flexneri]
MTSLKTSIKTITYLSDIGCLEIQGASLLALFVWLLTLHPAASGRVYAAYGGVYVCTALMWLRVVDGVKLTLYDWTGALIALCGMLIIVAGWGRT